MSIEFKDRVSTYPNRYKVTPAGGSPYYATLERADVPTELGTPLNAETLNKLAAQIGGKVGVVKLWENASPTSSFAQQTVQMDLSEYQIVLCLCRLNHTAATTVPSNFIRVGEESGTDAYGIVTGYPARRTITATVEGVKFGDGCKYTSFGSSNVNANNTVLIPVEIYGFKGVGV